MGWGRYATFKQRDHSSVSVNLLRLLINRNEITGVTSTNTFLFILSVSLVIMTAAEIEIVNWNIISPVFASMNRSSLLLTDLHLEECIKQLQLGNPEDALEHCELADRELGELLNNTADE